MRNAEATKRRILEAATEEFASYGLAGARVDRIADAASTSKAQLYNYFGHKQALFDAVFDAHSVANVDRVPITVDDLPGYAVRLYDAYLDNPVLLRLLTWARLERTPGGALFDVATPQWQHHLDEIAGGQRGGLLVDDLSAPDLFSLLLALAGTWGQASIGFTATGDDADADHERRRAALAVTVRRAFCR
jgi:AcrR family transcriptional regulator